jgi:hypothetical protein
VTSTRLTASGHCDTLSQLLPDCCSTRDIPLAEPSWRESAKPRKRRLPYVHAIFPTTTPIPHRIDAPRAAILRLVGPLPHPWGNLASANATYLHPN